MCWFIKLIQQKDRKHYQCQDNQGVRYEYAKSFSSFACFHELAVGAYLFHYEHDICLAIVFVKGTASPKGSRPVITAPASMACYYLYPLFCKTSLTRVIHRNAEFWGNLGEAVCSIRRKA
jgi:hypothetical protein